MATLAFRADIHCLAGKVFGGTPGGPRCQFRHKNGRVTLPMSLLPFAHGNDKEAFRIPKSCSK